MEMIILKKGSAEWEFMWSWLEKHPINEGLEQPSVAENPLNGEKWAYIGSFRNKDKVIHELRHRSLPGTNERHTLKLNGSPEFCDGDIEKIIPIK